MLRRCTRRDRMPHGAQAPPGANVAGALDGIRVVECAEGVAGPYCGRLLAGLGADVLKIEPPGGDWTRREGPFPGDVPHPEKSGLFLHLNTGKRSAVMGYGGIRAERL